jgi:hypothetical protein
MTMQIGMVGSDGIVVASDTRWTHEPNNLTSAQIGRAVRFGTNGIKIKVNMTQQVAVSFAADRPSAASMADEFRLNECC